MRNPHGEVEDVGQDLLPEPSLRRTAGEDDLIDGQPGDLLDDLEMAAGDVGSSLLDRSETLFLPRQLRVLDVELEEGWRRVYPALGLHQIREDPEHAVRSRWHSRRLGREQVVDVCPLLRRECLVGLAKRVSEPAHCQARVEADSLHHPPV